MALLNRRSQSISPWYYFWADWKRQTVILVAAIVVTILMFVIDLPILGACFGCFVLGTKVRDIRWWFALAKLWPDTSYFLDWKKVEESAKMPDDDLQNGG